MATRSKTIQAITESPDDPQGELPEWARAKLGDPAQPEVSTGDPAPSATPALDNLLEWLVTEADDNEGGTAAAMEAIVRQVLGAQDMAQALRQTLPQSASQFLDIPMLWNGYTIRPSDFEESSGPPFYASLQVMAGDPPKPRVINAGGWKILAQVKRQSEIGAWPVVIKIIEAAKAKKGQSPPLTLVMVDQAE